MIPCINQEMSAIVNVADETCIVALNKIINIIKNNEKYCCKAMRANFYSDILSRASHELNYLMPDDVRV